MNLTNEQIESLRCVTGIGKPVRIPNNVNRVIKAILPPVLLLFAGCDPEMTIRQTGSTKASAVSNDRDEQVTVRVATTHQLIGENWYSPGVEILNSSRHPITVTRVDLETWRATYENKPLHSGAYPVPVAVGKTMPIEVWFDLNDSVTKTFEKNVEVRVYYQGNNGETMVTAKMEGHPSNRFFIEHERANQAKLAWQT